MEYIHAPKACICASYLSPSCNYIRYRINIYCCLLISNLFGLFLLLCKLPFDSLYTIFPLFLFWRVKNAIFSFSLRIKKNISSFALSCVHCMHNVRWFVQWHRLTLSSTDRLVLACAFVASDWRCLLCELWTQWPDFMQLCKPIRAG